MFTRAEIRKLADAWSHLPEGAAGSPMMSVPMTPAALVWLMEMAHMPTVEATLIPSTPPLLLKDVAPDGAKAFQIIAQEPTEAPTDVGPEDYRAPSYGSFDLREGR